MCLCSLCPELPLSLRKPFIGHKLPGTPQCFLLCSALPSVGHRAGFEVAGGLGLPGLVFLDTLHSLWICFPL